MMTFSSLLGSYHPIGLHWKKGRRRGKRTNDAFSFHESLLFLADSPSQCRVERDNGRFVGLLLAAASSIELGESKAK